MQAIFKIVSDFLIYLSQITGLSYNEINIIIWYTLIPYSWAILLDRIFGFHYLKIGLGVIFLVALLTIPDLSRFTDKLFDRSVDFLNLFNNAGSNYIASSVAICVFVPLIIYGLLIWLAYFRK